MRRDRRQANALALAVAVAALAAVLPGPAGAGPSPAPMFTLEGLDGKPVSLEAYKGSPIILLFWAPW